MTTLDRLRHVTEQPTQALRWVSAAWYDSSDQSVQSQYVGRITLQQEWIITTYEDHVAVSQETEWRDVPVVKAIDAERGGGNAQP